MANLDITVDANLTTMTAPVAADRLLVIKSATNELQDMQIGTLVDFLGGWVAGTGTWSYSSADSPTFVISINADVTALIGVGDRIKLTQTTTKYFIVTAVGSFSGGFTLVTVYGGTDYTLANAAISSPYYSHAKAPFGFPVDPNKWTVTVTDTSTRSQATPVSGTWYNPGTVKITVPIGCWNISWQTSIQALSATATTITAFGTLSTANNSESDADFTVFAAMVGAAGYSIYSMVSRNKHLLLAAKTDYFVNIKTDQANMQSIAFVNAASKQILRAICAYL